MILSELKATGEAPEWLTGEGFKTLLGGYLSGDETPKMMYTRVAKAAASRYKEKKRWETKFFDAMWKGWLCPATPVLSNLGTARGLPISCNTIHVGDSISSIFMKNHELAMLSKNGAGVGIYMGDIRARNATISGNGVSEGVVPWAKVYDTTISSVSQGSTRRGAAALYLPVEHGDVDEFINIRRPIGDINRRCLNIHQGICMGDDWLQSVENGKLSTNRDLWRSVLKARIETGEPFLFFRDNVNRQNPNCYTKRGMKVQTSNICTEIFLYTDPDHTFVCCLSSLNLMKWNEWKGTDLPQVATRFLDAVISEYIERAADEDGLGPAINSAIKGRAIGIGVLGWHSYLQSQGIAFDSFEAMMLNAEIFKTIREKAEVETAKLAQELGEPEWCEGDGRRNTHLMAVAPTVSNSTISGGWSAGIEPLAANIIVHKTAKGTFIKKNYHLQGILEEAGKNTVEIWKTITENNGSVQHLGFLDAHTKSVYATAREINQFAIIKQAGQRQQWIDQGQSVNLFFASNSSPKYIHQVHMEAWKQGLKSLYYCRSEGVLKGDLASRSKDDCAACEG